MSPTRPRFSRPRQFRTLWVRSTKWAKEPLEETRFRDYKWIALGLGIMSAIALLFCWIVSDPDIDKNTFLFVTEVVLQFLGLIFYALYFWWTVTYKEET